nr:unnamed protein product [Digitaria exilis]
MRATTGLTMLRRGGRVDEVRTGEASTDEMAAAAKDGRWWRMHGGGGGGDAERNGLVEAEGMWRGSEGGPHGEEEETDDEAPERKPAPIQEAEEKGAKQPSSGEDKNPAARFQRIWSTGDEVRILEAMAAHRRDHGTLPQVDALAAVLAGSLDNSGCSLTALQSKITSLKRLYNMASKKGELPSKDHDRRIFDLSKSVWGSVMAVAVSGGARRDFDEMCELYPYLAEEVKALQRAHNGLFKREFEMMDEGKARLLDEKIKKQRMHQLRVHNRRHDLTKEVTKTLIDLVD